MIALVLLFAVAASGSPIAIHKEINQTITLNADCTYNGVDFSALMSTVDYTGADFAYTYKFNICQATVATYYGSDCVSGMMAYQLQGTFCTSNIATPANPEWASSDLPSGVSVKYNTGGRVCSGTIPASFTVLLECDEDAPATPPTYVTYDVQELSICQYQTVVPTSLACGTAAPKCGIDEFDFSDLVLSTGFYAANDSVVNTIGYHFNICEQVQSPLCGYENDGAIAHQYFRNGATINCQTLGKAASAVWSYNGLGQPMATFADGGVCGSGTRTYQIVFVCSPDVIPIEPFTVVEYPACLYTVQVKTQLAC